MVGKETPGVGSYSIEKFKDVAVEKPPSFAMPTA
jgi:hypothetical protein